MISSYLGIDSWAPYLVTLIAEPTIAYLIDSSKDIPDAIDAPKIPVNASPAATLARTLSTLCGS